MIKEYRNGLDFIKENSAFLDENKYMSILFYIDAKVLNEVNNKNYCLKAENNNYQLLAIKVEPYNLCLYGDKECLEELLLFIENSNYELDGIMCPTIIGQKLLEVRNNYFQEIGMDFMEASKYIKPSSKKVIKATYEDIDTIYNYFECFLKECGLHDKPNKDNIIKNIDRFRIIKEDGIIVSMAACSMENSESCRITHVYTNPSYRNRGYAKEVVNYIKNEILDKGLIATLNVDQKNPISNHVYASLGFKKVFSQGVYSKTKKGN